MVADSSQKKVIRAAIGLGSNVGDRLSHLRDAVSRIARHANVTARSRVYQTSPVGGPPQDDFLNAAVLVEYGGTPFELLDRLQVIEADLGRRRDVRWGPRTIDLDMLWIEGEVIDTARLVVPHPRLTERSFALVPMLELAPGAVDPRTQQPFTALAADGVRATDFSLARA